MAGAREIKTKIRSVQSTQKITKAMEMVAASKMRKAQERMAAARPYAEKMRAVASHLAHAHPEYRHPWLDEREARRVGLIVVSTDRGLCGALNVNLFRLVLQQLRQWQEHGLEADLCAIGNKGLQFFGRFGGRVVCHATHLGDAPALADLIGTIKAMLDAYDEGRIDRLYIAHNHFVNTMTQRPQLYQLLPITADKADERLAHHWDYIYEPEAKAVIDTLMTRYVESLVYRGVVENVACEMAARMVAMKAASDNAGTMIEELQLAYNKARQASITREIAEIVGGAEAVSS